MRKRRWRKRLGSAVLALIFIGVPLAFGVSNLYLSSPKGRAFIAARIQGAIQQETSVQGCTWSPWNGFTVHGLLIRQPAALRKAIPAPMLTAESIRIDPDWRELLQRRLVIRGVEIRKPDLVLAIELLSQLPTPAAGPTIAAPAPDLAAVEPQPGAIPAPAAPAPSHPNIPGQAPAAAQKSTPPPPAVVTDPTVWVTFTDARLKIVSAMAKEPLYRISRMDGSLPIAGKNAASQLVLEGIRIAGQAIPGSTKIPVKWAPPILTLGVIDAGLVGIDAKLEAKISLTRGMPFLIGAVLPKQDNKEIVLTEGIRAQLGSVAGQGRVQGLLLSPGSWQGQWIAQTLGVKTEWAGHKAGFDHGQMLLAFQGGVVRCVDARLVGEESSMMANGMALSDGRFAANLRIVASPESLISIAKFTQSAQSGASPPQLTPLSTPQRAALDMSLFGFPGKIFYQAHPAAKPVSLR